MSRPPPSMRLHATGQWFVYWGGRTYYLGRDRESAQQLYGEQLKAWSTWQAEKLADRRTRPRRASVRTVRELVAEFIATKLTNNGPDNERYNRNCLARFTHAYGELPISSITAKKVEAIKAAMQEAKFAPRTINHDVGAIRDFLTFVMDSYPRSMDAFNVRGVRKVRVQKAPPNAQLPEFVARYIRALEAVDPDVGPWMRLQYLAGLRPAEVPRVVQATGFWHRPEKGEWVYAIENKTERATDEWRYVVLTTEALAALRKCKPRWSRADSYSAAVARAWHGDPIGSGACEAFKGHKPRDFPIEFLRDSAYQRLMDATGDFTVARALMGHAVSGAWGSYTHAPWHKWRKLMARLTLTPHRRPPGSSDPAKRRSKPPRPAPASASPDRSAPPQ